MFHNNNRKHNAIKFYDLRFFENYIPTLAAYVEN